MSVLFENVACSTIETKNRINKMKNRLKKLKDTHPFHSFTVVFNQSVRGIYRIFFFIGLPLPNPEFSFQTLRLFNKKLKNRPENGS